MAEHPMANGIGLMRAWRAAKCSLQGLAAAWHNESAFRQEVTLALLFIPLGLWLGQSTVEKLFLLATVLLVLVAELLNSGLEAIVDRVGEEFHELSGRAKDMGSAAVFICLLLVGISYLTIAWQRFS